ncbi:MAG: hypothetical protein U0768_21955 [Anaerolineae bacterium]
MTKTATSSKPKATKAAPRRRRRKTTRPRRPILPPLLLFMVFVAVALATWTLDQTVRLIALWGLLVAGSLLLGRKRLMPLGYNPMELARGLIIGLAIGLPVAVLGQTVLGATAGRLFGNTKPEQLLLLLGIVAPIADGVYFRGFLQPAVGVAITALLYGLAGLLFFLPPAIGFPLILAILVLVMAGFGVVYGAMARRYTLTASIACQAAVSVCIWVLPHTLQAVGNL